MINRFFQFITYAAHPLLIPTYLIFILFKSETYLAYTLSASLQRIILFTVFSLTFLLPLVSSFLLLRKQGHDALLMEDRQERIIPYFFTLIYYLACYYFILKLPVSSVVKIIILAAACCIALAFVINLFWKISIHMIGMGGMAGALYILSHLLGAAFIYPFVFAVLLAGLVGTARLLSASHTHAQLYVGFLAGFSCEYFFIMFSLS
jgi:uncharacterized membrane protein